MEIDNVTPGCKEHNYDLMKENSFDDYISFLFYLNEFEKKELIVEIVLSINERSTKNLNIEEIFQGEEPCYEDLVLKEFPKHPKYAFLGEERPKPVIVATDLNAEK